MDVAIFGLGRIGQIHLRHLVETRRVKIKYLVDVETTHGKIKSILEEHNLNEAEILTSEQSSTVFNDKSIVAVFVCIPLAGKCELVCTALNAGKHVFCEKPMARSMAEVEEAYRIAAEHKLTLQCGFNKRFDESVRKMYNQVRSGEIGKLRMIKLSARELPGLVWRDYILSSGGIFIDTVVHEFDLMVWLAGERPCSITSYGHAHNKMFEECGDVDGAVLLMKFPSGLIGFIEQFRAVPYGYDQRFEVLGSDGMLLIENPKESQLQKWTSDEIVTDQIWQQGLTRYTQAYKDEIQHFFNVVEGKETCIVKAEEVMLVHLLAEKASQAMKTGQVVGI